jgi:hypothetical protein
MLNHSSMQAIFIRAFIDFIMLNTKKVNEELDGRALVNQPIFHDLVGNVLIEIRERQGKLALLVNKEQVLVFTGRAAFNKRTINELNVWFHREHRSNHNTALNSIKALIDKMSIRDKFNEFTFFEKLIFTSKEFNVSTGSVYLDEEVNARIFIQLSLLGNFKLIVETTGERPEGVVGRLFPAHCGLFQEFTGRLKTDPVDSWFKEVLRTHVEQHLK